MFTVTQSSKTIAEIILMLTAISSDNECEFTMEQVQEAVRNGTVPRIDYFARFCFYPGIRMDALYAITGRKFLNQESLEQWHRTFDAAIPYIYGTKS